MSSPSNLLLTAFNEEADSIIVSALTKVISGDTTTTTITTTASSSSSSSSAMFSVANLPRGEICMQCGMEKCNGCELFAAAATEDGKVGEKRRYKKDRYIGVRQSVRKSNPDRRSGIRKKERLS